MANPTHLVAGTDLTIEWSAPTNMTDLVELSMDADTAGLICVADGTAGKMTVPSSALDALLGSTPSYVWVGSMTGGNNNLPSTGDGLTVLALTFRDAASAYVSR
jgi:hypothetical protein